MRVAVIGGGISGLSLAYYLQKLGVPYDLLEASEEVGGTIRTLHVNGYVLECGPNALQMSPELHELITDLKLENEVLHNSAPSYNSYVLRDGYYQTLPATPLALRNSSFFSRDAKERILQERKVPATVIPNETVTQFFVRRFGTEVTETAIIPFVTSMFAGDPDQLLIEKALPKLKEMEIQQGTVLEGLLKLYKNPGERTFTFTQGMGMLPEAIARKLISLHTEHQIDVITRNKGKYILSSSTYHDLEEREYDAVVLALPAHLAADLVNFTFPGLSAALQNINYPPMAVVHTVYNRQDVAQPLDGFGAMNPRTDSPFTTGAVWASSLFRGRCKPHEALLTSFVGGASYADHALLPERELMQRVHKELKQNYGINAVPVYQHVTYWEKSIPQYDAFIEDAHQIASLHEEANVFIAANWQGGVTVSECIREAKALATKISMKTPMAQSA